VQILGGGACSSIFPGGFFLSGSTCAALAGEKGKIIRKYRRGRACQQGEGCGMEYHGRLLTKCLFSNTGSPQSRPPFGVPVLSYH